MSAEFVNKKMSFKSNIDEKQNNTVWDYLDYDRSGNLAKLKIMTGKG